MQGLKFIPGTEDLGGGGTTLGVLVWRIPSIVYTVHGVQKSGHDWVGVLPSSLQYRHIAEITHVTWF